MYSTDKFLIGRRVVCMAVITSMFGIQIRSGTLKLVCLYMAYNCENNVSLFQCRIQF